MAIRTPIAFLMHRTTGTSGGGDFGSNSGSWGACRKAVADNNADG
jgi:hypothetical protein